MSSVDPIVIVGGGLAGSLAALALAQRRHDVPLLLLEGSGTFGGNHVWSFFDGDVSGDDRWLIAPLVTSHWDAHEIRFPARRRVLRQGYNSVTSTRLDMLVRERLRASQYRLHAGAAELRPDLVRLEDGVVIKASAVIDARGPGSLAGLDLGWQKFVGRSFRLPSPHGRDRPIIMDAIVDQTDGYRFVYTLPFSTHELLIEDTYYSTSPSLDVEALRGRIDAYAQDQGWSGGDLLHEETGVLPVALGGDVATLWNRSPAVPLLGLRGGFFHPTTGYSLPDAVANATLLAGQRDLSRGAIHALYRGRAERLWRERRFYRILNRMLLRAAAPERRFRVLEHFYRLPLPVIARFYGGRASPLDKLRILSGRPPVPLASAVAAVRGKNR